ncbi:uncharacterized protein Z519_12430 [Cladophialophora bantiana CBS 173.52]|uniref:G-protein coupled receptors family 3 profile domain-containing protein n=1 Tax=Cladophialophora bantiana (strain ATCC 10958 / CBS 173.52 / CDC B-1940 / NIH 8579) TaxID=1442370 RepID=A0A0D2H7Y0_CLAB1|nr:uncharacterized protein Z519_12430 [Cladophialophora bantiana CBS 173.52]KIW86965.1 hypothetical protein Z519_12430 [Cladophialophora bantiana CBS 173.52]
MGGPYPSKVAGIGGVPTVTTDIPVDSVFIILYVCFAATNMTIFQLNRRKNHKFIPSALLFGFCMARIVTLCLRIGWATAPHDVQLAIAAQIFVNAGILIVYIINLILAQRILRASLPQIGWNPILRAAYKFLYIGIGVALAMVIASVVVSSYTLDPHTKSVCRDIQLAAITYLLIFTCLPAAHTALVLLLPRSGDAENFGKGSMKSKLIIVTSSACLCMLIAGFKAGITWETPRPVTNPPWYDSKACFYVFNFTLEIILLGILTFTRIDKRFFVPNGSKKAGDYSRLSEEAQPKTEHALWYATSQDTEKP